MTDLKELVLLQNTHNFQAAPIILTPCCTTTYDDLFDTLLTVPCTKKLQHMNIYA